MSENNEYYADKLRRLLEKRKTAETAGSLDSAKKVKLHVPKGEEAEEPVREEKDFSFDGERPKHQTEELKEAEAEAVTVKEAPQKEKKIRKLAVTAALIVAIIVLGAFCIYKLFFVIHDIRVEGNAKYTSEQILAAVGAEKGDNLYSFSSKVAADSIRMYCPEIGAVTVKRTPPGRIVITVVEDNAAYYAEVYGEIRTFTKDLRVLGVITTADKCEGLIKLKLPEVQRAVAGEQVRFIDNQGEYVFEAAKAVAESELYSRLGTLDLSSAHDIRLTCDGKYILKMGSSQHAPDKLKIAAAVLKDDMFKNNNKATIDLTNMSETGVIIDNQLEID